MDLNLGLMGHVFSVYRPILLSSVQGHSGMIRCISDFRQHCSCTFKIAGCRAKQTKIWASGGKYLVHTGYVDCLSL